MSYSDRALRAAASRLVDYLRWDSQDPINRVAATPQAMASLDAAHDRETLGLDASMCIREVIDRLRSAPSRHPDRRALTTAADFLLREFESNGDKP